MPVYVNDGNVSFAGGQNDGLLADRIRPDQYRRGINVTTKDGALGPRPGFIHKELTVITEGGIGNRSYSRIFNTGKFQAAMAYDTDDGQFLIAVISGIIFRIDPRTSEVEVIPIGEEADGDRMNQFRRRLNWSYAGRFLVFFDFPNLPVILENRDARRSNPDRESSSGVPLPEVPVSAGGTYVQNRLWVRNAVHEFTAGDPVGGINADAPITFEEVLAEAAPFIGQVFSLGSQSANQPITAMGFLQVPDTSTGVGPLIVATKNSIYAFRADLPRDQWEQTAFGRLLLYNAGIAGGRAFVNQNSDLIFLSGDNQVRSLLIGRSQQERWENTPLSREIGPWLDEFVEKNLMDLGFVASYKNRVFVSVAPYRTSAITLDGQKVYDYAHGGIAVLELDNVSVLGQGGTPAWAGLWTGISPMEIVISKEGPYVFSKDDGGINRLYFMDENASWDEFEGRQTDIISRIYTREYDFGQRFEDKTFGTIDYSMSNIAGDLTMLVEYKPGHSNQWSLWKCFKHEAQTEICDAGEECGVGECELPMLATHAFRELDFGDPLKKDCDPLTGEQSDVLRKIGLRITMKGKSWKLEDIRLRFQLQPNTGRPATQRCETIKQKKVCLTCEPNDWEIYRTGTRDAEWPKMNLTL